MAISSLILDKAYVNSFSELVSTQNSLVGYVRICTIGQDFIEFVPGRNDSELPNVLYGTEVKVNISNPRLGFKAFSGTVTGNARGKLKVGALELLTDSERRQFLRVNVGVEGDVSHTFSATGDKLYQGLTSCRLEDISLSGLRFSTPAIFNEGDRVTVHFVLMDFMMNLGCVIKRIVSKENTGSIHYGCFYERMSPMQEESLHKLLLKLQQARRASSR